MKEETVDMCFVNDWRFWLEEEKLDWTAEIENATVFFFNPTTLRMFFDEKSDEFRYGCLGGSCSTAEKVADDNQLVDTILIMRDKPSVMRITNLSVTKDGENNGIDNINTGK